MKGFCPFKVRRLLLLALATLVALSVSLMLIAAAPAPAPAQRASPLPAEVDPLLFVLMLFFGFMATEGTVEYILGTPFDKFEKMKPYKWLLMYVSLGLGIFLAFYYALDIVALLGKPTSPVGMALTGIVMGRGANFVNDLWSRFLLKKPTAPTA